MNRKQLKGARRHATKKGSPSPATLKALDALNFGEHVTPAMRARLVSAGFATADGRLTDRGQHVLDQRLAREVLGRDYATKKKPMTEDQKRRVSTYRSAWKTLDKAHTLLMAEPGTKKLADDVMAALLKLDDIIARASM